MEKWLKGLSVEQLFELTGNLDADDMAFLEEGVRCNMRPADYGLKNGPGWAWGKPWKR